MSSEQRIDPLLVERVAAVLKARSGGHFEAVRDQADEKFRGDAEAVIDELGLKEQWGIAFPGQDIPHTTCDAADWRPVEQGDAK